MSALPVRREGESITDFAKRRAEALGYKIAPATATPGAPAGPSSTAAPPVPFDEDLIPDAGTEDRPPEEFEIDAVLGRVDILEAYRRWCGKMEPNVGGKRESIMVSCPSPAHPDANPSAWLNLDRGDGGVGMCGGCEIGFDKYDIAAWRFGFGVPDYKGKDFPELRRKMAEDLGYRVMVRGKDEWLEWIPPDEAEAPVEVVEPAPAIEPTAAERAEETFTGPEPALEWRDLPAIKPGTFLHAWLEITSKSYEPEEFYLWEGLMALASAVSNQVTYDDTIPVRPNVMVCLIGATGTGKSIAMSMLDVLLRQALPWDRETGGGVRSIGSPGSGEALLDSFTHSITDSSGTKTPLPVNGLYRENELASFMKRTARTGNTTREILMDLYDRPLPVAASSRGHGSVVAEDHFMQMVTSTQPGSMGRLLSDADAAAGFLNRWVFAWGTPKKRPARGTVRLDLTGAVDPLKSIYAWAGRERVVGFHDESAGVMWDKFYDEEIHPLTMDEDAWMAARLPLLAKKILLLFAINEKLTTITVDHVLSLMAMWPYLLQCYGIVSKSIGNDELEGCLIAIERYLRDRPEGTFTFRQISKQSGAKRFRHETIGRAIFLLVQASMIAELPRAKSDRVARYRFVKDEEEPAMATVTSIHSS